MSHTISNLEHHHRDPQFRRPGDLHVHFFGTATLSFCGWGQELWEGDEFEIDAPAFGRPLRNSLHFVPEEGHVAVAALDREKPHRISWPTLSFPSGPIRGQSERLVFARLFFNLSSAPISNGHLYR